MAFDKVCHTIDTKILKKKQVLRLTDLCTIYTSHLKSSDFPNEKYRAEKLKAKIERNKTYKSKLDNSGKI